MTTPTCKKHDPPIEAVFSFTGYYCPVCKRRVDVDLNETDLEPKVKKFSKTFEDGRIITVFAGNEKEASKNLSEGFKNFSAITKAEKKGGDIEL